MATYSYYPYHYGGTEVYVAGLATYLQKQGHQVTIIAGMPPVAFTDYPVLYEDSELMAVEYSFDAVRVVGIIMKHATADEIYSKFRQESIPSWIQIFEKLKTKWDVLHMHAYTSAIGLSMIRATKQFAPLVRVVASYHLPVSCVKNSLLFGDKLEICKVTPAMNICTACMISEKQRVPLSVTSKIVPWLPMFANKGMPTFMRVKYLVNEFVEAFRSYDREVDLWHVFSEQVKQILQLNDIKAGKIDLQRHGVAEDFFIDDDGHKKRGRIPVIFLYASRLDPGKGICTLLRAWNQVPEAPDRELWVAGTNQNKDDDVIKAIKSCGHRKDIRWMGKKDQYELAGIMKRVHCTIIPSEAIEIGPLVFHEAIAAGSNVIASRLGGCEELGKFYQNSILFEAGDHSDLAEKILHFQYTSNTELPQRQHENYSGVLNSYYNILETSAS